MLQLVEIKSYHDVLGNQYDLFAEIFICRHFYQPVFLLATTLMEGNDMERDERL